MGARPWFMKQEWKDVVFLHWPVKIEWLCQFVPEELEIDLYGNQAWVSVVFFQAKSTRLRFLPPVPGANSFLELNARTYVKYGKRRGVYFFSLDADNRLVVKVASQGGFLPYYYADMSMAKRTERWCFASRRIESGRFPESFCMTCKPCSDSIEPSRLERWLTERYCLWTKPKDQLYRVDISHLPWSLYYLKGQIHQNTMAPYLPVSLNHRRPLTHYSKVQKVRFYAPVKERK